MAEVITIILAGGQGRRLYPLTKMRSKPAVPIAGKFRLIDIPISNCIHSGLKKIFILTQFSSESLHRHIFKTYLFDSFSKDFVTILSAQQTSESVNWYQGTADAVRQNMRFFHRKADLVLILSGDHLYKMNYQKFIDFHVQKQADISISVYPVSEKQAPELGVMKVNRNDRITAFLEKPNDPEQIESMKVSEKLFQHVGIDAGDRTHLASMGVYLFNWDVLNELLEHTDYEDFGKGVIPYAISQKKVYGYLFGGYWADIGTVKSFFDMHMDLTAPLPKFNFYDEDNPIFTHARFLPSSKILLSEIRQSIVSEGSIINRSQINHSIIGLRTRIGENSIIDHAIVMGAEYFESVNEITSNEKKQIPNMGIGNNCEIRYAIIDINARIGHGVKLLNVRNIAEEEHDGYVIRDGIIIIPVNSIIPDGTVI
ncbi:glucose-1-phosphate adenylyltransferase [candidate division KSB1 bacterium]|nr:glucose-1-phosphate adenylyltransferase [candidate division KSB1 bacterium]